MVFCNHCREETEVETDDARGIKCCIQCGRVLEDIAFSADVTFQKDAAGESTVVGQFVNESGVARGIGRIHGGRVYAYQADSHERAQQRGRQDIAHLVDFLLVRPREETIEASHRIYKLALQRGFTRGRRTNQVAAACLYLVCRQDSKPFLLIDFSDALQINVFTLGAVFLQLAKLLRLEEHPIFSKPVDPSLYIHRFADRMNFPTRDVMNKVAHTAIRLVASMKRDWIQTGRRPSGICGAALFIAAHLHGYSRAKRDIVAIVHIGEHTLAKRLTEFSSTEAARFTGSQFEKRQQMLEANEQLALQAAAPEAAPANSIAGCEHIAMGEQHFKQGMCRACYEDFVKTVGGTFDGANPPAFDNNRAKERKASAALLALPEAPEAEKKSKQKKLTGPKKKRGRPRKVIENEIEEQQQAEEKEAEEPTQTQTQTEGEDEEDPDQPSGSGKSSKEDAVTAAMIAAAEKEVEGFDAAIAEAEAEDQKKSKRRRTGMSTSAAVAAATAMALQEAAQDVGENEEEAAAVAGAFAGDNNTAQLAITNTITTTAEAQAPPQSTSTAIVAVNPQPAAAAAPPPPEVPLFEDDDGKLSEIADSDIEMYICDDAEVACKEEIWNLMNQDWVEKQAAKKAAMEAAQAAQEEQRKAMEAAAAAGIQYKRGRGRPLGSKTKPKPQENLPPPESAQEAAMRMLDTKKLSSKINYSALADLFSDEPGNGEGEEEESEEEREKEDDQRQPAPQKIEAEQEAAGAEKVEKQPEEAAGPPKRAPLGNLGGLSAAASLAGLSGSKPPAAKKTAGLSKFSRMAPKASGAAKAGPSSIGASANGSGGGAGRLGGLNEGLSATPVLGSFGMGGLAGATPRKKAAPKNVRFKPGTKTKDGKK